MESFPESRVTIKDFDDSECRSTLKGFAFGICFSAWIIQYFQRAFHALCPVFAWCHAIHKRCFTPLNPVSHGLMQKIKGAKVSVADSRPFATPHASLSGEFLHRLCRMLRSPELSPTSSDVLNSFLSFFFIRSAFALWIFPDSASSINRISYGVAGGFFLFATCMYMIH